MPLKRLQTLSTGSIYKNPYWEYRLDNYTLPNGAPGEYHYVHTLGAAMVVALDRTGSLVLVKQIRYLLMKESIEFPGGGVKGEDFLLSAKNELAEEAGFSAANWTLVGEFDPYNGVTDEICRVYFATGLEEVVKEKDPSEEFEVLKLTADEFQSLIDEGGIWDGMTLAAWGLVKKTVLQNLKEVVR
ncbi:MAG: NUDIX hydrolase [Bacteroidetes bacterium]|nr:NUDIX hydrolase [Bacteroidota bacterium]